MSAWHCGCDPEANHLCGVHEQSPLQQAIRAGIASGVGGVAAASPAGVQIAGGVVGHGGTGPGVFEPEPLSTADLIANAIRRLFPGGHPKFLPLTLAEIKLHAEKNHDYAAGGDPLGNFKRVGGILAQYPDLDHSDPRVVALIYMLKQLDATLWGLNSRIEHKVEGLKERMGDVSIYAKLVVCLLEDKS